jgi:hypothetical protein
VAITEQRIALIDEIENRTHDQRDKKSTPGHSLGNAIPVNL